MEIARIKQILDSAKDKQRDGRIYDISGNCTVFQFGDFGEDGKPDEICYDGSLLAIISTSSETYIDCGGIIRIEVECHE